MKIGRRHDKSKEDSESIHYHHSNPAELIVALENFGSIRFGRFKVTDAQMPGELGTRGGCNVPKKGKKPLSIRAEQVNPWVWAQMVIQAQPNPKPVRIAPDVRRAIAVGFSEADRPAALAALRQYRGPETPRVHRAVLALSAGRLAELEAMIGEANKDYRDVLFWAEYPEESTTGTLRQKRQAARRMADRWRQMGLRVPLIVSTPEGTGG